MVSIDRRAFVLFTLLTLRFSAWLVVHGLIFFQHGIPKRYWNVISIHFTWPQPKCRRIEVRGTNTSRRSNNTSDRESGWKNYPSWAWFCTHSGNWFRNGIWAITPNSGYVPHKKTYNTTYRVCTLFPSKLEQTQCCLAQNPRHHCGIINQLYRNLFSVRGVISKQKKITQGIQSKSLEKGLKETS